MKPHDEDDRTVRVEPGRLEDVSSWLELAREVEPLFGPMLHDPRFRDALVRNIERGTAFCVRVEPSARISRVVAGIMVSPPRVDFRIGWLAVTSPHRRTGLGRALVEHVLGPLPVGTAISVVTFSEDVVEGRPARRLYERLGFRSAGPTTRGEDGRGRQIFRKTL